MAHLHGRLLTICMQISKIESILRQFGLLSSPDACVTEELERQVNSCVLHALISFIFSFPAVFITAILFWQILIGIAVIGVSFALLVWAYRGNSVLQVFQQHGCHTLAELRQRLEPTKPVESTG